MRLALLLVAVALIGGPVSAGALRVTECFYRPQNGAIHLLVKNEGSKPVSLLAPVVDGHDLAGDGYALWYRIRPDRIPGGGMAEVIITLEKPLERPASVSIATTEGDKLDCLARSEGQPIWLQSVSFSPDLRTIDIYTRWQSADQTASLRSVLLDGKDVSRFASPWPSASSRGLAWTRVSLPAPLPRGSFHTVEVIDSTGRSTGDQVRAIPAALRIGVYGGLDPAHIADYAAHGINHYIGFGAISPANLDELGKHGISASAKFVREPLADRAAGKVVSFDIAKAGEALTPVERKPAFIAHHLVDEPDVADYHGGRRPGITAPELLRRQRFVERTDPSRFTFVQIDNTFRPENYRIYGEVADISAAHRYSLGSYLSSEAGAKTARQVPFLEDLVQTLQRFRMATQPRPFEMVTQFFNLGPSRSGRAPTPEEMRLQCYAMISQGAKGVHHYIHSASGGGGEGGRDRRLWDSMTGLHAELSRIALLVATGTPAPAEWVTADSPQVMASALVCGERLLVVLINKNHRSALESFTCQPIGKTQIAIQLPPWIRGKDLHITTPGRRPVGGRDDNGVFRFVVDELQVAEAFVIEGTGRRRPL